MVCLLLSFSGSTTYLRLLSMPKPSGVNNVGLALATYSPPVAYVFPLRPADRPTIGMLEAMYWTR